MGFVRKRKLYQLDFTGTGLEGLTVNIRGMSVEEALQLSGLERLSRSEGGPTEEDEAEIRRVFDFVASKIESWDLVTEEGEPVPVSGAEMMSWDAGDAFAAISAWQSAVMEPPAPLERRSSGGSTWQGPPIPMDVPSPNLPS